MPQADGGLGPHRTNQGNKRGAYYSDILLFGCNLFFPLISTDLGSVLSVSLEVVHVYASAEESEWPGG